MKSAAFRDWLDRKYAPRTAQSRASEASRVEAAYGDLDAHYARDALEVMVAELNYSTEDERSGKPNPTRIVIAGNVRNGLASLKQAVRCYQKFAGSRLNEGKG